MRVFVSLHTVFDFFANHAFQFAHFCAILGDHAACLALPRLCGVYTRGGRGGVQSVMGKYNMIT